MEKINLNNFNEIKNLSEADHTGILMFLLDNEYNSVLEGGFHCKDFMQEFFYKYNTDKTNCEVYGFYTNTEDLNKIDSLDRINVMLKSSKIPSENEICLEKYIKDVNEVFKTDMKLIDSGENYLIFNFDKKYTNYPALLSLIFYFLRTSVSLYEYEYSDLKSFINSLIRKDLCYFNQHMNMVTILNNDLILNEILNETWQDIEISKYSSMYYIHNNTGFVSKVNIFKQKN